MAGRETILIGNRGSSRVVKWTGILKGNTHYPEKVSSLFEPHTEAIRGEAH